MGMFDSVQVPCPKCKRIEEFQSKSGDCILEVYTLENVPANVVLGINRHSPYECRECKTKFAVRVKVKCEVVTYDEFPERGLEHG